MASPILPLFLNGDDTAQILLAIEYGLPLDLPIMPVAGVTGPITPAVRSFSRTRSTWAR